MTSTLRGPSSLGKNSCADDATRDRSRDAGNASDEFELAVEAGEAFAALLDWAQL
jgi:hypothetical protein